MPRQLKPETRRRIQCEHHRLCMAVSDARYSLETARAGGQGEQVIMNLTIAYNTCLRAMEDHCTYLVRMGVEPPRVRVEL